MRSDNMPRPFAPEHSEPDIAHKLRDAHDEIERLRSALRYEQHRSDRVGTHGPDCYAWGPAHWECAMRETERLRAANLDCLDHFEQIKAERDRLRERIERAPMRRCTSDDGKIDLIHCSGLGLVGKDVRLVMEEG